METVFDIPKLRKGYRLDLPDTSAYYFDIEHDDSHGSNFLTTFNNFIVENNWHRFITTGATVIDIGGHTGDTAIPLQYLARGTVLAVEPMPDNVACMEFNCAVNGHLGKFVTVTGAVTTQDDVSIEILDHSNGLLNGGTIDPSWSPELQAQMRSASGNKVTVNGMTLETLCKRYLTDEEINNISFIKSDTEGHDISIISSSREFIDRLRPVLFIEWFSAYTSVENQHMFQVIEEMGYIAFDPRRLEPASIDNQIPDLLLIHNTKVKDYL
jgi:FkbM family methyltransferase